MLHQTLPYSYFLITELPAASSGFSAVGRPTATGDNNTSSTPPVVQSVLCHNGLCRVVVAEAKEDAVAPPAVSPPTVSATIQDA